MVRQPAALPYAMAAVPVLLLSLALYVPTLLPDVGTWDTAEFQAIGPVLGIAHPTGYPTYTLLAWLASVVLQPVGNEAYRADLLSALLMAATAALGAVACLQLTGRWALGLVAGTAFAVAPIAWRVATRADAHALHVAFAGLLLVLLIEWRRRERPARHEQDERRARAGRWLLVAAVIYGLSLGNHALTLLLAPGIGLYVLLVRPGILWRRRRLVLGCLAVLVLTAAVVYAYLPIRSSMDPPLDYASPRTPEAFWYVVLGEQFQGSFGPLPAPDVLISGIWDVLVANLGILVVLVPAGALLGATRHGREIVLTGAWFVATWLFAIGYPNASIERYYLVPLLVACVWIALAADVAWDALRALVWPPARPAEPSRAPSPHQAPSPAVLRSPAAATLLGTLLVAGLVVLAVAPVPGRYDRADASDETFGRDWLEAALDALAPRAAVVSWWSYSTPLWYGRWVEGRREDIVIIDDRDVIDDGFGSAENAIDHHLGERPVYVIRLERDLPALARRYVLQLVPEVPSPGELYRVVARRPDPSPEAA